MTQNNNKQPSQELLKYLIELKTTISKLKELYKAIDKKAAEEGFSIDEIYEIANITDIPITTQKSIETTTTTPNQSITTTNTTNNNNNKNEETKYFQRYFQHFQ